MFFQISIKADKIYLANIYVYIRERIKAARTTHTLSRCIYMNVKYSERRKRYSYSCNYPDSYIYNASTMCENSSSTG